MRITLCDPRPLAVTLARPDAGLHYNWATGAWEGPFNAAAHARDLAPMVPPPPPATTPDPSSTFAAVQSADVGQELLSRPDAVAIVLAVSGSGASSSYTAVDVWSAAGAALSCAGAMTRL